MAAAVAESQEIDEVLFFAGPYCPDKQRPKEDRIHRCKRGHGLLALDGHIEFLCSGCAQAIPKGAPLGCCYKCNYHACMHCLTAGDAGVVKTFMPRVRQADPRMPISAHDQRRLRTLVGMAELHLEMGEYAEAILISRKSVEAHRNSFPRCDGDHGESFPGEANALRTLIRAMFLQAQEAQMPTTEAHNTARQELQRFQSLTDQRGQAMMKLCLAEMSGEVEPLVECENCNAMCEVDIPLCPSCGGALPKPMSRGERIEQALSCAMEALLLFEGVKDKRFGGLTLVQLGYLYFHKGDATNTAYAATQALKLFSQIVLHRGDVQALRLLAFAYVLIHEFEVALEKANEALAIAQFLDRLPIIDEVLDTIIWIHKSRKHHEETEALAEMLESAQDPHGEWKLGPGEPVATIAGNHIVWADRSAINPCIPFTITTDGKIECTIDGQLQMGRLLENLMLWEDGDVWVRDGKGATKPQLPRRFDKSVSDDSSPDGGEVADSTATLGGTLQLRKKSTCDASVRRLRSILEAVGVGAERLSLKKLLDVKIADLGLTSTQLYMAQHMMSEHFKAQVPISAFFGFRTIRDLATYLVGRSHQEGSGGQIASIPTTERVYREVQEIAAITKQQGQVENRTALESKHDKTARQRWARQMMLAADQMPQFMKT